MSQHRAWQTLQKTQIMPILLLSVLSLLHVAASVGYLQQNLAGLEPRSDICDVETARITNQSCNELVGRYAIPT